MNIVTKAFAPLDKGLKWYKKEKKSDWKHSYLTKGKVFLKIPIDFDEIEKNGDINLIM